MALTRVLARQRQWRRAYTSLRSHAPVDGSQVYVPPQASNKFTLKQGSVLPTHQEPRQSRMPVLVQEDRRGVIKPDTSVARILENGALIVERQMEMMNVFLGFEQASKFVITDAAGNHIGYLAEEERGISQTLARQAFRTHRASLRTSWTARGRRS